MGCASKDALGVGVGEHGWEYVPFIRPIQYLDERTEPTKNTLINKKRVGDKP